MEDLAGLLGVMDSVSLSNVPDRRVWLGCNSGSYSCASFFSFLTCSSPNTPTFPVSNFVWKSKAPPKGENFLLDSSFE